MLTRGLFLAHGAIACYTLQTPHNVVNNAKSNVVETNLLMAVLGDFLVSVNQFLDSKGTLMEILSHFLLPEVVL